MIGIEVTVNEAVITGAKADMAPLTAAPVRGVHHQGAAAEVGIYGLLTSVFAAASLTLAAMVIFLPTSSFAQACGFGNDTCRIDSDCCSGVCVQPLASCKPVPLNTIYYDSQTAPNNGWAGDVTLGGLALQIAVGRSADGRLEVFYVGTNNAIYHNWQTAPGSWAGEVPLGGLAQKIAVGRNADGRLEVFYVGTNNTIYHNWQVSPNSGWAGENAFSGNSARRIAVTSNADGRLETFYVGTNNHLYHNWQISPNGGWAGENGFGNSLFPNSAFDIAVGRNADGRLEVFYVGTNNALYHNWQTSAGSTNWNGEARFVNNYGQPNYYNGTLGGCPDPRVATRKSPTTRCHSAEDGWLVDKI